MTEKMTDRELEQVSGGVADQPEGHVMIVNCKEWCNVRGGSSKNHSIIGRAKLHQVFIFYKWEGNWAKICFDGKDGYVYKTYATRIN